MIVQTDIPQLNGFGDGNVAADLLTGASDNALFIGVGLFAIGLLTYLAKGSKRARQ